MNYHYHYHSGLRLARSAVSSTRIYYKFDEIEKRIRLNRIFFCSFIFEWRTRMRAPSALLSIINCVLAAFRKAAAAPKRISHYYYIIAELWIVLRYSSWRDSWLSKLAQSRFLMIYKRFGWIGAEKSVYSKYLFWGCARVHQMHSNRMIVWPSILFGKSLFFPSVRTHR